MCKPLACAVMVHQRCVLEPHVLPPLWTWIQLRMFSFSSLCTSHYLILCLFTLKFSRPQWTLTWEGRADGCTMFSYLIRLEKCHIFCLKQQEPLRNPSLTPTFRLLPKTDWDSDLLPADFAAEVALSGSEEQDLHRRSAAVFHGHCSAGPQYHLLPDEPGDAVQEGKKSGQKTMIFRPVFINGHMCVCLRVGV